MTIELPKEAQQQAVASIERYFQENMDERIGNMAAGALLNFFLAEIGPTVYNLAVAKVQDRLQQRVMELDSANVDTNRRNTNPWTYAWLCTNSRPSTNWTPPPTRSCSNSPA